MFIGINGWELILLGLIAFFVLGPDRLPGYAAKLAQWIRRARVVAEGAKDQLKEQLGPEYDEIDWQQYDPRQYDPRRIVREALLEPLEDAASPLRGAGAAGASAAAGAGPDGGPAAGTVDGPSPARRSGTWDPERPTPYDVDAT